MDFYLIGLGVAIATIHTASGAGLYNSTCEANTDCYEAFNFICVENDIYTPDSCNKGWCNCVKSYYMAGQCERKKRKSNTCLRTSECEKGLACKHDQYGLTKCVSIKRLGEACTVDEECVYDNGPNHGWAKCNGTCQCFHGLVADGNICRQPRVGEACSDLKQATTCTSMMLGEPSIEKELCHDGTCVCPSTAEQVNVTIKGHSRVFCLTKNSGTKMNDGQACTAHNMCSSNYCGYCPGSPSTVCLRPRAVTAAITTDAPSTGRTTTQGRVVTSRQGTTNNVHSTGGSTPVSTAGGHNGDINGAARQLTYSCVLAVLFGMLLV